MVGNSDDTSSSPPDRKDASSLSREDFGVGPAAGFSSYINDIPLYVPVNTPDCGINSRHDDKMMGGLYSPELGIE